MMKAIYQPRTNSVVPKATFDKLCATVRKLIEESDGTGNLLIVATASVLSERGDKVVARELDHVAAQALGAAITGRPAVIPMPGRWIPTLRRIVSDTRGVVAVEYAMILAGIGVPALLGARHLAPVLMAWLQHLDTSIATAQALLATLGG